MIRTRDLVLYMLVLFFCVVGIAFTVATDRGENSYTLAGQVATWAAEQKEPGVAADSDTIDRTANLEQLREKLARGEGEIIQGVPVLTSVDTPAASGTAGQDENPDTVLEATDRPQQYCEQVRDFASIASSWPHGDARIEQREGARLVRIEETVAVSNGTSTAATTTDAVVLQLPLYPTRQMGVACLDSEIIGVALDGSLIRNDETWRFRSAAPETIVGYARDGFPIYGQSVDESQLDMCGGYDTGAGYQYHLREKELFILGCFAAPPQDFIE